MRRALRWIVVSLLIGSLVIVASGTAILFGASRDDVVALSTLEFSEATGLQIETDGTFEPVFWPIPGWRLGSLKVSDPLATKGTQPLLSADESLLTIAPLGLLQRTLNIGALWLDGAQIRVPTTDLAKLDFGLPDRSPIVSFLRFRNAEIFISEGASPDRQNTNFEFATLDYAGSKRPLRVALKGTWRNRQIEGKLKLTSPDRAVRSDWVFADAKFKIDGDAVTYAGRFKPGLEPDLPVLSGNVTAQIANPAGAVSWLMQAPPDETLIHLRDLSLEGRIETLPERFLLRTRWAGTFHETRVSLDTTLRGGPDWRGSRAGALTAVARAGGLFSSHLNGSYAQDQGVSGDLSFSVLDLPGMYDARIFPEEYRLSTAKTGTLKGRLSATPQGFALADTRLILGRESYTGDAAIDLRGKRPLISLGTTIDALQLDSWLDPVLDGQQPLDEILPNLDTDLVLEVTAETVQYQELYVGPAVVSVSSSPDALVFDLRQLDLAGGVLTGSLSAPPNSSMAKLELAGAEIDSDVLLKQFGLSGVSGIMGGTIQADVPFPPGDRGWKNVAAEGTLSLYQVEVEGIDLRRSLAASDSRSAFAQADLQFSLDGETLTSENLSLRDSEGSWSGQGILDLASREIDAVITAGEQPGNPLRLSGTLDSPTLKSSESFSETQFETDQNTLEKQAPTDIAGPAKVAPIATPDTEKSVALTGPLVATEPTTTAEASTSVAEETAITEAEIPAIVPKETATGPETAPLPRRPNR